jgi:hypothetical protein
MFLWRYVFLFIIAWWIITRYFGFRNVTEKFSAPVTIEKPAVLQVNYYQKPTIFIETNSETTHNPKLADLTSRFVTYKLVSSVSAEEKPQSIKYTDIYDFMTNLQSSHRALKIVSSSPKYLVCLLREQVVPNLELYQMNKKRIGYLSQTDADLMKIVLDAYNIVTTPTLVKVDSYNDLLRQVFKDKTLDGAVIFGTQSSPNIQRLKDYQFVALSINQNFDTAKLKTRLPYTRITPCQIPIQGNLPGNKKETYDTFITSQSLTFDTLFCIDKKNQDNEKEIVNAIRELLTYMTTDNSQMTQNYYSQFVEIHEPFYGGSMTSTVSRRDKEVHFTFDQHVNGEHQKDTSSGCYIMQLDLDLFETVPVKVGDRIVLSGQKRKVENGYYYVTSVTDTLVTMTTCLKIVYDKKNNGELQVNKTGNTLFKIVNTIAPLFTLFEGDAVFVLPLKKIGTVIRDKTDLLVSIPKEADLKDKLNERVLNGKYICYEDPKIKFLPECIARQNAEREPYHWDRPCETDEECPFFNSKTKRGGCTSGGYCEFPVGIKRVSFREYDKSSKKYCSGCPPNVHPTDCCSQPGAKIAFPETI